MVKALVEFNGTSFELTLIKNLNHSTNENTIYSIKHNEELVLYAEELINYIFLIGDDVCEIDIIINGNARRGKAFFVKNSNPLQRYYPIPCITIQSNLESLIIDSKLYKFIRK